MNSEALLAIGTALERIADLTPYELIQVYEYKGVHFGPEQRSLVEQYLSKFVPASISIECVRYDHPLTEGGHCNAVRIFDYAASQNKYYEPVIDITLKLPSTVSEFNHYFTDYLTETQLEKWGWPKETLAEGWHKMSTTVDAQLDELAGKND